MSGRGIAGSTPPVIISGPRLVEALASAAAEVDRQRPGAAAHDLDLSRGARGPYPHVTLRRSGAMWTSFTPRRPRVGPLPARLFERLAPTVAFVTSDRGGGPHPARPREWLLIKALLNAPQTGVQWMFVSLRSRRSSPTMRERAANPELVARETVMLQPKDSLPHDDHMHLRTACTPEEAVVGCEGGGPYWPWLPPLPTAPPPETDDTLAVALLSPIEPGAQNAKASPFVKTPGSGEAEPALSPEPAHATPLR
jgi:penicillin-insensitive murein endopeptidase